MSKKEKLFYLLYTGLLLLSIFILIFSLIYNNPTIGTITALFIIGLCALSIFFPDIAIHKRNKKN